MFVRIPFLIGMKQIIKKEETRIPKESPTKVYMIVTPRTTINNEIYRIFYNIELYTLLFNFVFVFLLYKVP
jgi:hypothetical protein